MKVYVLQSVEHDKEEDQVWGYIYSEDDSFEVFPTFYKAFEYLVQKKCPDWDIEPGNLYAVTDHDDPRIRYIYEKKNDKTFWNLMWAVIIEREMNYEDNTTN